MVKMVDLGPNSDCSESEFESKSEGESGTIINIKDHCNKKLKNQKSVKH